MKSRLLQILVIVVLLASTPVMADIPLSAFDLPKTAFPKTPEKRAIRPHKTQRGKTSARALRQPAAPKTIVQQPHIVTEKQPEKNKGAVSLPLTIPDHSIAARAGSVSSRYLLKLQQGAELTWKKIKQEGRAFQSTTSFFWLGIKRWVTGIKGEF